MALRTLRLAIQNHDDAVSINHRAFPLELFNGEPTPRRIVDPEIVAIASLIPALRWECWAGPASTYPVTMLPAMAAVQAAKDPGAGGLRASDQLDEALRHAFYTDHRCISIPAVILDIARECSEVDDARLEQLLAKGAGIDAIYTDFHQAKSIPIQGSPVVESPDGSRRHNPGTTYHWTGKPPRGFPRLENYETQWADDLLTSITLKRSDKVGA